MIEAIIYMLSIVLSSVLIFAMCALLLCVAIDPNLHVRPVDIIVVAGLLGITQGCQILTIIYMITHTTKKD